MCPGEDVRDGMDTAECRQDHSGNYGQRSCNDDEAKQPSNNEGGLLRHGGNEPQNAARKGREGAHPPAHAR